ncbi:xylose isomerase-like TIM barrel protein [Acinetobacter calcoaceticus]|uniref:Xylose isomerase-like TIM barrel protein n=1 Tax=Acinetobacter calcoaceticus TaxID=471 RepID=A0A4R1Y4Q2_ACICA|nr:xylose isomerase-like TIM barrel protein [Acinetobacter calcoaceticus]
MSNLCNRIDNIPLYLHAYAYHLNMRVERILPHDLLNIARESGLVGLKIHVLDGETQSLGQMDDAALTAFKMAAIGLDIHIETSASDANSIDHAVHIAQMTGATSVRFYPRYEGLLNEVLAKVAADLQYIKARYQDSALTFSIEQHEDLTSQEMHDLVVNSGMQNLSILFDFANMINANEAPLDALRNMAPVITQVHIKDALIIAEGKGFGHQACRSGEGDIPMKALLKELLLLGKDQPQVTSYGLEEEVDYYAPAFRFDDEGDNPFIPWRQISETALPTEHLEQRLAQEIKDAQAQLAYVRQLLAEIKLQSV